MLSWAHSPDGNVGRTHGGRTHSYAHRDLEHEHHLDDDAALQEELLMDEY